jgi:hypothetical protein
MDPTGSARRIGIALGALALAAALAGPAGAAPRSVSLAAAASSLAGTPVDVTCVSVPDFNTAAQEAPGQLWAYGIAGLYEALPRQIVLTKPACAGLARIATLGARPVPLPAALAVFTLAHEVGHELYGPDEPTADRYGLAHAGDLARALGLRGELNYWMLGDWIRQYAPLHDAVS